MAYPPWRTAISAATSSKTPSALSTHNTSKGITSSGSTAKPTHSPLSGQSSTFSTGRKRSRSSSLRSLSSASAESPLHSTASSNSIFLSSTRTSHTGIAATNSASLSPTTSPGGPHSANDHGFSELSKSAKNAIIACTVIGGLLILALLIFLLWRRRRKSTDPEARPPSRSTFLSAGTRDAKLTALPAFKRKTISPPSNLSTAATLPSGAALPPMAERPQRGSVLAQDAWKTGNPPTPVITTFPRSTLIRPAFSQLKPPLIGLAVSRHSSLQSRPTGVSSYRTAQSDFAESIAEEPSVADGELGSVPRSPSSQQNLQERWSWTNSQAPPTPRMYAGSGASSISTMFTFRTVNSWIRGQIERRRRGELDDPPPLPRTRLPVFKNKASKPTLAPAQIRKLSKRQAGPSKELSSAEREQHGFKANPVAEPEPAVLETLGDDGVIS